MKQLRYITIFCVLLLIIQGNSQRACAQDVTFNEEYPDSLIDGSFFMVDDSLLSVHYPDAFLKTTVIVPTTEIFSHTCQLHYTPINSTTSNYLIITTSSLYNSLHSDIVTYAENVHTICGYGIYIETIENATPEDIKSVIISYQDNLCGVFFIGDFGNCLYESNNDYGRYGYKKWPCDLFYMDLDGVWSDTDGNGIYDQHTGNVAPEIFMGRLSASGLSSLGDEITLIGRQLQKSHDYLWKASYNISNTVLNYIDKDWNGIFLPNTISSVFSSANVDDVRYGVNNSFSPADYLQRQALNNYGFTHLAAHSSPVLHQFTNGYIYLSQLLNNASFNYAYNLFCCSACNWMASSSQGYLGGVYLFNQGKTIAVVGSTKIGGMLGTNTFYSQFPNKNIGEAFLYWWQHHYGNSHSSNAISWSYGMTILGDPTINFRHDVHNICEENLILNTFPSENKSNFILFKAGNSITVSSTFTIPQGVHVVFDAPSVTFSNGFTCPIGASFETRSEGCEL